MTSIRQLFTDRRGATAIEYALIASLISVAALSAFMNLGDRTSAKFNSVDSSLSTAL